MELTHRFTVPGTVEETWARFGEIADLATCFPGAQVTAAEGDTFEGTVKVKLGPIALVYAGSGAFVAKDPAAHTFTVEAKGRDKRGNGTAGAIVNATMAATADGTSTDVRIDTDLTITGKPAQFGRGVMQDVSDKLLAQFVACLEHRSAESGERAAEPAPAAADSAPGAAESAPGAAAPAPVAAPSLPTAPVRTQPPQDDAIDLGATVLPVLLKSYGKQVAAGLGALLLVLILWRRRGRRP
ncbi:MAG: SRPBCC family protein [Nocardioides sp.]